MPAENSPDDQSLLQAADRYQSPALRLEQPEPLQQVQLGVRRSRQLPWTPTPTLFRPPENFRLDVIDGGMVREADRLIFLVAEEAPFELARDRHFPFPHLIS